ncbi:MAG: DUF2336 domain-containing protein [Alphaproteobacteria bacterium]
MSMPDTSRDMPSLIAMAREGTKRSRQILAENVLDLVISQDGRLSDRERALSDQVLIQLVQDMELQVRQQLALKLSEVAQAPEGLIAMLARDDISVAGPLLERSMLLKDSTLIEIVQMRTREHQLCIAMRSAVSMAVSDSLVEHAADPDVLEALVRNPKAAISSSAMDYLVAESRRFDQFQDPLLSRADLPAPLAHHMFWWVSAQLRQKILTEFKIEEYELDPVMEGVTQDILTKTQAERQNTATATAASLAKALDDDGALTVEVLINMLRKERISAFCAGMSHLAGVPVVTINRIILDKDITPFAILCKATRFSEAHFSTMALLLLQGHNNSRQSTAQLRNVLELFKEVSSDQALLTLKYWHNDSALQKAALKIH